MSNTTSTTPLSKARLTGHPARANTESMARFSPSTSAVKRAMPWVRAMAARCSSRIVDSPRPWCSSATVKATSASSLPAHRS